jgi:hypothetical protein
LTRRREKGLAAAHIVPKGGVVGRVSDANNPSSDTFRFRPKTQADTNGPRWDADCPVLAHHVCGVAGVLLSEGKSVQINLPENPFPIPPDIAGELPT